MLLLVQVASDRYVVIAQCGSGFISPVPSDGGHLLAGVSAICVSSTAQCRSVSFAHFLIGFCLLTVECTAQLAIVKQMSRQESRSSAGNSHADEPAGITQLSRP